MRYINRSAQLLIYLLAVLLPWMICAQAEKKTIDKVPMPWVAFNNAENLGGFKDLQGNIQIEPKFINLSNLMKFNNIVAVTEALESDKYVSYYLLKNGQKVAENSVYIFDNGFDCESEESIRFRDSTNGLVGFLDAKGKILIPAIYSDARPFRNGLAIVLKNAEKMCHTDGQDSKAASCEHWYWSGGNTLLIDKNNNVLISGSIYESGLDWYSVEVMNRPSSDLLRESFLGVNGQYYTFVNFNDAFEKWLFTDFLMNLNINSLLKNSEQTITFWDDAQKKWVYYPKVIFMANNFAALKASLSKLKNAPVDLMYSITALNQSMYDGAEYAQYFDDCGEAKTWRYPKFELVLTHRQEGRELQDVFEFLKTPQGFKLLGVSLRSNVLH